VTLQAAENVDEVGAKPADIAMRVSGLTRRFGDRLAIETIDCEIRRGEILAVLGDNGAGSTTLFDILAGADLADRGSVTVIDRKGEQLPAEPGSRRAAIKAGIAKVGHVSTLAGHLTVLQNIMLGRSSLWRLRLARPSARRRITTLIQRLSMRFPFDTPVHELTAGDRLRIEVVRALYAGAEILLLDEPTTHLTRQESEALFQAMRVLAKDGLAIAFATHKRAEALDFADRVLVLRAGRKTADLPTTGKDRDTIAAMEIGRQVTKPTLSFRATGESLIEFRKVDARGANARASLKQVSFELRSGEMLGIAGIAGNGQATLAEIAAGLLRPASGTVLLYGRELRRFDAGAFIRAGIGCIPLDCIGAGIVADLSVAENIALESVQDDWSHRVGMLRRSEMRAHADDIVKDYQLDCPQLNAPAAALTSATIQKLVVARVLGREPKLIIACDPTRGLDAAGADGIHRWLSEAREAGAGILLISEDVDELFALADSIAVLHQGSLTLPQPTAAFDAGSLGHTMGGHGSLALDWAGWGET
jgi:general nucleoside transport system ATP-binding protein